MNNWEYLSECEPNPPRRREIEKVLREIGWRPAKKSGPHVVWYSPDGRRTTLVSGHKGRDLPYGTFRKIIKDAGITEKRFYNLL
jgi:predicted RNA binding protein YcfA (HicA-like mRNA interferase family)